MSSRELLPGQQDATDLPANEVQFALVISRMLETVKDDPEFRRQLVYDLARYKLQEQFTYADAKNIDQMKRALEVAIEEVEKFSREEAPLERLPQHQLTSAKAGETGGPLLSADAPVLRSAIETSRRPAISGPLWPVMKRTGAILLAAGAIVLLISQRDHIAALRRLVSSQAQEIALVPPRPETTITVSKPEMVTAVAPPLKPTRVLPTDYGVYALIDDKSLAELNATGVMAPDMRVAISPEFKKPDRPHLPNGRVKFIVFRRDAAHAIPERVEVRVVAKIAREFSTDAAGKTLNGGDDVGVIRNFAYPFRVSPIPGTPEMHELHTGDSELELAPGHYVLSLGTQAYYFQVDGEITDPRQCLERVVAGNGTFYAPCKKARTY
ncbi:blr5881 [Bradyrhizobium diazoefficiens USDA 110]|uniref:Blr5881 protein n=2 Tax=Bradyrhizobium diazoefficiens TaxID=1355477 RepID=Q89HV8_BRADU|nr:hypothetical protein AAV28_26940 [Bradyrhizobium diazoefficiens USDA 110]MBR0864451.1 hypothetical protein [Bradyrhizobium diazoefficiens]MBR0889026.1 hypothetical protein [Bradyrhizobium diazoefficiens]MBR0920776.1 hypothetical protein [Bradyrhizobium diazoefficiens]QBP24651.1 hypothetical protein Bdiaspc4_31045 [Bradyrhizobium diazoefficiens]